MNDKTKRAIADAYCLAWDHLVEARFCGDGEWDEVSCHLNAVNTIRALIRELRAQKSLADELRLQLLEAKKQLEHYKWPMRGSKFSSRGDGQ